MKKFGNQIAGMITATLLFMSIAVIAAPQAEAQSGIVYMKIYNSKTDTEKVLIWDLDAYRFEKSVTVSVDDLTLKKIYQIFHTNKLRVHGTVMPAPQTATWHHFTVTIGSDMYRQVTFV